jgi:hypothetical protein
MLMDEIKPDIISNSIISNGSTENGHGHNGMAKTPNRPFLSYSNFKRISQERLEIGSAYFFLFQKILP